MVFEICKVLGRIVSADSNIEAILAKIAWDKSPLIPTIAQDSHTKEVLMLAYSSAESLRLSLQKGIAHYFSRSKNRLWQKGEESGNVQTIHAIHIDCDNDAILFLVNQKGFACHTGNMSCFFKKVDLESLAIQSLESPNLSAQNRTNPYHIIDNLYHILQERKFESADKSYTAKLYAKGENAICKKIIEESGEVCFAIKDLLCESKAYLRHESKSADSCNSSDSHHTPNLPQNPTDAVIYETADLIYHLLVGLSYCDISPSRVMDELKRRFGTSGIDEKKARKK